MSEITFADTRDVLEKMGHTLRPTTNIGVLMGITYDAKLWNIC